MTYPAWLDLTPEQRKILVDRACKHRALLHNQAAPSEERIDAEWNECQASRDTRVDESEVILDTLLRRYAIIGAEEQIEEIAHIHEDADKTGPTSHLCIMTNLQTIELPYTLNNQGI